MRPPRGRLARLTATHLARTRTRALVRAQAGRLQPGLYVRAGETTWRHWRATLPSHLRLSKVTPARSAGGGRARISAVVQRWLPPITLRLPRGGPGTFSVAVAADDGGVVLLDPAHGKVGRIYGSGPVDADYVMLRRRYEQHLQTPRFEVVDGGRLLVEDLVRGSHFVSVRPGSQINAIRALLQCYASLTRAEGESTCEDRVQAAVRAVESGMGLAEVRDLLHTVDVLAANWPLVPSATDANVKNLILVEADRPVPIDLGNLRLDPFFYYPIGVITMARGAVLEHYLDGGFDDQIANLFAAAGSDPPLTDTARTALLALRTALVSYREAERDGPFDQETFDRAFSRRWALLWSGQPPALA